MPTYFQRPENALKRANVTIYFCAWLCCKATKHCHNHMLDFNWGNKESVDFLLKFTINSSHIFEVGSQVVLHRFRLSTLEKMADLEGWHSCTRLSNFGSLKRFQAEFIDVGKKQRALDALYDVIKSKKHRTWQKIHEPIMEKYLALCVELRKSHIAKEGLYQYKNICQQVNIKSLEDVVRKYILLAEKKTEEARKASHQAVVDVDDLEMPDTPESLLLKAVSGEDTQTELIELFLLLGSRKNYTLEDFRKCNLRTHLGHIHKHQHQQTAINLNNPDSQAMHLETRLVQLDSAINMELWQEAFKAVEDIHGLIGLSKKSPKPSLMANYYQKLGLVFWKSGNTLFHACTLHRLYQLSREQRKNMSQEELQKLSYYLWVCDGENRNSEFCGLDVQISCTVFLTSGKSCTLHEGGLFPVADSCSLNEGGLFLGTDSCSLHEEDLFLATDSSCLHEGSLLPSVWSVHVGGLFPYIDSCSLHEEGLFVE
ncbi:hypothetical protein KUTeg_004986 [Tegillarca granosa]|uniref:eIF3a PCI domain-containing protein n=1 Tax=Tegillarca granosa TaxID=220873 RepID=A0ABQ9FMA9_TEGGR|nr:hypothetical protein KUTeg_004986 [Tegillarca granosa]